jgi:hypothetical protein
MTDLPLTQRGERNARRLEDLVDYSMVRIGLGASRILTLWDTEQDHCGNSEAVGFLAFLYRPID